MKYALLLSVLLVLTGCCSIDRDEGLSEFSSPRFEAVKLLQGNLDDWPRVNFGGEGPVYLEDDALNLDYGSPLTGVVYQGDLDALLGETRDRYAITLQAQRVEGVDLFLGLTFPVGQDGHVSLVLGGWGGAITGLSSLDNLNASENATTQFHSFEDGVWYDVKVSVTPAKIVCTLDGKTLVDINRADYEVYDTYIAVEGTKPLGLFSYSTWGRVRDMKVWKLNER